MTFRPFLRLAALAILGAAFAAPAFARPETLEDCEKLTDYYPRSGQQGKDVVWVPTPDPVVTHMLKMAAVSARDFVIDLGAGDGKIAIAAAKEFGARSLGIEYNPQMVKLAQCMLRARGVEGRARIIEGDIFKEDFSKADVLTMFLLPQLNLCVRHRVLAMPPGTRVVSNRFTMSGWESDETAVVEGDTVYLWIVPARVAGEWSFREIDGPFQFTVNLSQTFQAIGGEVTLGSERRLLLGASLRGDEIRFTFNDDRNMPRSFTGKVNGAEVTGILGPIWEAGKALAGSRRGAPPAAPWAQMDDQCGEFYGQK